MPGRRGRWPSLCSATITRCPLLCGLVAVFGGAGAFFYPAMSSLKPTLVPLERRRSANATLNAVQTASLTVGPAAAGVLIAAFGAPFGFLVNALSFLASAVTVALIRARAVRAERVGFLSELRGGFAAVRSRDWLLWGVVAAGVYHVANGVVLVTVNVVALRDLGGPSALGVIAAAEGLGGVIGSVIAMRVRPSRPLVAGFVALGLMPVWVMAYVWPGTLTGVLLGAVIGYSGLMFFGVCWETAIQNHVPHDLLGPGVVVGHPHLVRRDAGGPGPGRRPHRPVRDPTGPHRVRGRDPRRRGGPARGSRYSPVAVGAGSGRARLNRTRQQALVRSSALSRGDQRPTPAGVCGPLRRRNRLGSRRRARSARSAGR